MPGSLIAKLQTFCERNEFEREFEDFAKEKFDTFKDIFLIPKEGEQPIEFFEVYNQYLTRFEERIEQFIRKEGYIPKDFFQECKAALDDDDVSSSERFFVEFLLATSEYESFLMLMRCEIQSINRERSRK